MNLLFVFTTIMAAFWAGEASQAGKIDEATSYLIASIVSILVLIGTIIINGEVII